MLENQRLKTRRRVKLVIGIVAIILFAAGIVYLIYFSQLFNIQNITVNGINTLSEEDLGVYRAGNIIFWKLDKRVSNIPQLASINIRKDFLKREIVVDVTERNKDIIWCLEKSGQCFWVDENGFIFNTAPNPTGALIVKAVKDYSDRTLSIGNKVLPDEMFKNLELIFKILRDTNLPISEMKIANLKFEEITAITNGGPMIYFSLSVNPSFSVSVLESLKQSSRWGKMRYLDLRVANRAYYSL